MPSQQDLWLCT